MHGSLLHGFKQFVLARGGPDEWQAISELAGVDAWFKAAQVYPDADFGRLLDAAASRWGRSRDQLTEDYGAALVPTLMTIYGSFIDPGWGTLGLLERAETVIHRTVRMADSAAAPPRLRPRRVSSEEVQIEYDSERRLCFLGMGICRGVAAHFNESVAIDQPTCRERGDAVCLLRVRQVPA